MKKAVLLIIDGAGIRPQEFGNAVTKTTMPNFFKLLEKHGYATLAASGPAVGLDPGMVGNSEVGHMTIGAGHCPPSMLQRISTAFVDGTWNKHNAWKALSHSPRIHIVGLVSDAGIHGHWRSITQTAKLARQNCPDSEIIVHLVLDGVDSKAGSAPALLAHFGHDAGYIIGLICGRKWFCDRSGDLSISRVFANWLSGKSEYPPFSSQALQAHLTSSSEASFSAHVVAKKFVTGGEPIILTSHRADRVRQCAEVLSETNPVYSLVDVASMIPAERIFFPDEPLRSGLAFEFRDKKVANTRIAEKCKFPHVTHFLNGLNTSMSEESVCVPSVADSALPEHPEMSIAAIVNLVKSVLTSRHAPHALVVNIANLDQIGHLGQYELACVAASYVDQAVWEIYQCCQRNQWELLITSDHGNADLMIDQHGAPYNSHSNYPVPLVVIPSSGRKVKWIENQGTLANVAPTFLTMMGMEPSRAMAENLVAPMPAY